MSRSLLMLLVICVVICCSLGQFPFRSFGHRRMRPMRRFHSYRPSPRMGGNFMMYGDSYSDYYGDMYDRDIPEPDFMDFGGHFGR